MSTENYSLLQCKCYYCVVDIQKGGSSEQFSVAAEFAIVIL